SRGGDDLHGDARRQLCAQRLTDRASLRRTRDRGQRGGGVMANRAEPRILIADDQADIREALRLLLKMEEYRIDVVSGPVGVLDAISRDEFDVLLIDLNFTRDTTSGQE